ncbi:tetratricopeptide repeat protein [Desulfoluna butyratoxydans]|uniref:Tetratricopeptide repeat n=1 Tax=Desulfoluna butyratoxydans TaxID=231438 RepID=A0A4U8YP13_9BACT|nr:tetratricopeptide repeat protein [Desulfoluna butyratoxydans]VFQ42963.1 tetratricopeptide repeat [Desulfoluna butyratoxydans]
MTTYCLHHPHDPAHWSCPLCGGTFCNACVKTSTHRTLTVDRQITLCPRCNREMDWIGAQNAIVPYWERLPHFFLYPLTAKILLFLGVLGLLHYIFDPESLPGMLVSISSSALVLRYAYLALTTTSSGDLTPPPMDGIPLGSSIVIVLKQGLVAFLLIVPYAFVVTIAGQTAGYLLLVLIILCVPAIIILLATSNRVLHAVNPNAFIRLATRIGKGYLGMFGLLTILWGAPALVVGRLAPHVSPNFLSALTCVISGYYSLVSYHLMGYVTLQYHESIGYDVAQENFKAAATPMKAAEEKIVEDPQLKQVTFLLREGRLEDALAYIGEIKAQKGELPTPELSEKYFSLLNMLGHTEKLTAHGHTHLDELITAGKKEEALAAYAACMEADPDFVPSAGILYHIGTWTSDRVSPEQAIAILQRAIRNHPDDPMLPAIWFRAARILNDRLHQHDKALKLLNGILKKFPEHDIAPQVRNYLSVM